MTPASFKKRNNLLTFLLDLNYVLKEGVRVYSVLERFCRIPLKVGRCSDWPGAMWAPGGKTQADVKRQGFWREGGE